MNKNSSQVGKSLLQDELWNRLNNVLLKVDPNLFDMFYDVCRTRNSQTKESKANPNELKRKPKIEERQMSLFYLTKWLQRYNLFRSETFNPPKKDLD